MKRSHFCVCMCGLGPASKRHEGTSTRPRLFLHGTFETHLNLILHKLKWRALHSIVTRSFSHLHVSTSFDPLPAKPGLQWLFGRIALEASHWNPCSTSWICLSRETSLPYRPIRIVVSVSPGYPVSTASACTGVVTLSLQPMGKKGESQQRWSTKCSNVRSRSVKTLQPRCWCCFCMRRKLFL